MPNGCRLIFEPFVASSVHVPLGLVPGNIYGQSTEAIDIGDGVCKRLIARPTFGETGDIVAMSCNCSDGSVITAEPTWNERGDVVWQEVLGLIECQGCTYLRTYTLSFEVTRGPASSTATPHLNVLSDLVTERLRNSSITVSFWGIHPDIHAEQPVNCAWVNPFNNDLDEPIVFPFDSFDLRGVTNWAFGPVVWLHSQVPGVFSPKSYAAHVVFQFRDTDDPLSLSGFPLHFHLGSGALTFQRNLRLENTSSDNCASEPLSDQWTIAGGQDFLAGVNNQGAFVTMTDFAVS